MYLGCQLKRVCADWSPIAIFASSVLVTVVFWAVLPGTLRVTMDTDYAGFYAPVARNIAAGNGITQGDGSPAIRYPPGYPLLLSGAFWVSDHTRIPESWAVSTLTLLCVGLAATSLFLVVRQAFDTGVALAAAALWMTYPFVLWLTKEPMSEVPFIALLYLALYVLWRAHHRARGVWLSYALVGILIGFTMLIRPIAMGLGVLLAMYIALRGAVHWSRRLALGLVILLGNLAVVAPWVMWVHAQTDQVVLLSSGSTPSVVDGLTYAVRAKGYRASVAVPEDVRDLMEYLSANLDSTDDGRRPGSRSDGVRELSTLGDVAATLVGQLHERPGAVLMLFGQKAIRSWYAMDSARYEGATLIIQCVYLAFVVWGGLIAWKLGGKAREYLVLATSLALYFWVMTAFVLSILRYMVPAMGLLIPLIPVGVSRWASGRSAGIRLSTKS